MRDFCDGFFEPAAPQGCCSPLRYRKDSPNLCFTFTGKEKDAETGYNYHGARYYDAGLLTGWLSVDPMADKYLGISPYAYCANNPVKLVDPDGKEIFYTEGTSKYIYKKDQNGKYGFFDVKTGKAYSGTNDKYVNNLVNSLGTLKEGKYGRNLVEYFEGSDEHHTFIRESKYKNQNPSGNIIEWSDESVSDIPIANDIGDKIQSEKNTPFVSLGHELAHVRDRYNGRASSKSEGTAMLFENLIRYEHGLNQRTFHAMKPSGMVDFDSEPAPTFRSNLFNLINRDPFKISIP